MIQDQLKEIIDDFFAQTSFEAGAADLFYDEANKTLWYSLRSKESNFLIGRAGETLFALNHLIRKIIERSEYFGRQSGNPNPMAEKIRVIIDVNDYQKKRFENLKAIAHMMAERARFFKSNVEIEPMPAHERRVIHEFLSGKSDIATESTGEGKSRRVVIKYIPEN